MVGDSACFLHSLLIPQRCVEQQHISGTALDAWETMESKAEGSSWTDIQRVYVMGEVGDGQKLQKLHKHRQIISVPRKSIVAEPREASFEEAMFQQRPENEKDLGPKEQGRHLLVRAMGGSAA